MCRQCPRGAPDDPLVVDVDLLSDPHPGVGAGEGAAGDLALLIDLDQDRAIGGPRSRAPTPSAGSRASSSERPSSRRQSSPVMQGSAPASVEHGGRDVDVRRRQVDAMRGALAEVLPGDPDHRRHLDRLLVGQALRLDDPVLAVEEAVVGVEDEGGVVELAPALQDPDQLADPAIGLGDRGGAAAHPPLDRLPLGGADPGQLADVGGLVGDAVLAGGVGGDVNSVGAANRRESAGAGQRAVVADSPRQVIAVGGELVELQVERVVGGGQVPQQSVRPAVQIAGRVAARVVAVHRPELAVDGEVVVAVVEVEQADPVVPARCRGPSRAARL